MSVEETIKKIEEIVGLLKVFGSKRKPTRVRKIIILQPDSRQKVYIVVGLTCVGTYMLDSLDGIDFSKEENILCTTYTNYKELDFYFELEHKNKDNTILFTNLNHLKKINKFFKLSKPSKKVLEKLNYRNKSFVLVNGKVFDITTPEARGADWSDDGYTLPRKEDLMNQKVYIHGRDPVTNSMLMAKDFDMEPMTLNRLIFEVITMNPHLVRDLNIDYYEEASNLMVGGKKPEHTNWYAREKAYKTTNPHLVKDLHIDYYEEKEESNLPTSKTQLRFASESSYTAYRLYYSIHEELYAKIVASMPRSTDLSILFKREKIASDYMKAFINMKEHMYDSGMVPSEVDAIMGERKVHTCAFIDAIKLRYLRYSKVTLGEYNTFQKSVFNHINHKLNIDAVTYKTNNNRNLKSVALQDNLLWVERVLTLLVHKLDDALIPYMETIGFCNMYLETLNVTSKTSEDKISFIARIIDDDEYPKNVYKHTFPVPFDKDDTTNKQNASLEKYNKLIEKYGVRS